MRPILLLAALTLAACAREPAPPADPVVAAPYAAGPHDGTPVASAQGRTAVLMDVSAGTIAPDAAPPMICADMFGNERRC